MLRPLSQSQGQKHREGTGLARGLGARRIYLIGLVANLASMALLVLSRFAISEHALAYVVLLVATGCLGVGFGFTVPTLNTFAAAFFPQKVDKAVLAMNACWERGPRLPRSLSRCSVWESGGDSPRWLAR